MTFVRAVFFGYVLMAVHAVWFIRDTLSVIHMKFYNYKEREDF